MAQNKAHTATLNRIAQRYHGRQPDDGSHDLVCADFVVEVETTATLEEGIGKLLAQSRRAYIAVTNLESLSTALEAVEETPIGVMDPQGEIVREAGDGEL